METEPSDPKIRNRCALSLTRIHIPLRFISLLEPPDLVLATPTTPNSNGGTRSGVTVIGQVDILVRLLDEDAVTRL